MKAVEHPDREQVMAFLDGELSADRGAEMSVHLQQCDACRSFSDELSAVSRQLAAWRVEPVPATLDARVDEAVRARGNRRAAHPSGWRHLLQWQVPRWSWALAGAAAVVAVAIGVSLPQLRRAPQNPVAKILGSKGDAGTLPDLLGVKGVSKDLQDILAGAGKDEQTDPKRAPLVARTATVHLIVADLDPARAALVAFLATHRGYGAQLDVSGERPAARMLTATVNVPADQLDAALVMLRGLGRVLDESQGSEDVTASSVDLEARLANARRTEQRLAALLQNRGEKVADVLAVEREASRVRGEIEQMEALRRQLTTRIDFATIELRLEEERRSGFTVSPPSIGAALRNAAVDGLRGAVDVTLGLLMLLLRVGPTLLLWSAVLAWPLRALWQHRACTRTAARRS